MEYTLTNKKHFLPYARQEIDEDDINFVAQTLRSDYLTTGPANIEFENKLSDLVGTKFATCCSSGTAALHLSVNALDLKPGDRVIVPTITFLATANAPRYVGADIIFCDVDPETGLMGVDHLEAAIRNSKQPIAAVFPVHHGGQSPDIKGIATIARSNNMSIVEDASHAIGSLYSGEKASNFVGSCTDSDITTFSFHPTKNIAMGEGGAATTTDKELDHRLKLFRNHGMYREESPEQPWFYQMHHLGFNYRASEIHCALGISQLNKLAQFSRKRRFLVELYDILLKPFGSVVRPVKRMPGQPVWHLYLVLIDFCEIAKSRGEVMKKLDAVGIGSQVHYIPVHQQPYYEKLYGKQDMPGAEKYYNRCLSLPLHTNMEENDVRYVVEALCLILNLQ